MSEIIEEVAVKKFYSKKTYSIYKNSRFSQSVKMADLGVNETVLDFGCFTQSLKKFLPKSAKYIGYDHNQKYSDIKDWREIKDINTVFALAVFEHLPEPALERLIAEFKNHGIFTIVAEYPWENSLVNRFLCLLFGENFQHFLTHPNNWKAITKTLNKNYECVEYRHLFWLTWITVWKLRA